MVIPLVKIIVMEDNFEDYGWLDNPYDDRSRIFMDDMHNEGFVSEVDDGGFKYFHCDLSKIPLKMRIEYYTIEIDRIAFDLFNGTETNELEDIYYNCKMLQRHMISLIKENHCE